MPDPTTAQKPATHPEEITLAEAVSEILTCMIAPPPKKNPTEGRGPQQQRERSHRGG